MKQKILIPSQTYDLKNEYVNLNTPLENSQYVMRGYSFKPKDQSFFSIMTNSVDKEFIFDVDLKKDPRRSQSTKEGNPLLFAFDTIFGDKLLTSDLTINMPSSSETTIDLIMNQFLTDPNIKKENNLTLTLNGSLTHLYIDRSNVFKNININTNNNTELFAKKDYGMYSRAIKLNVIDNIVEEINLVAENNIEKNRQPSYWISSLQSYSLKKIKFQGQKWEAASNMNRYKLPNLQEMDLSQIQLMDFKYTMFLDNLTSNDSINRINPNLKIKLNPKTLIEASYTEYNKPTTLKKALGLKKDDVFEITFKELVKKTKERIEERHKKEQEEYKRALR